MYISKDIITQTKDFVKNNLKIHIKIIKKTEGGKQKKLCIICRRYLCPPACPSYKGVSPLKGRPIGQCEECERYIYGDDEGYFTERAVYCEECAGAAEDT